MTQRLSSGYSSVREMRARRVAAATKDRSAPQIVEARCQSMHLPTPTSWEEPASARPSLNARRNDISAMPVAPRLKRHFFSPLEMSPRTQSRDDTRTAFQFGLRRLLSRSLIAIPLASVFFNPPFLCSAEGSFLRPGLQVPNASCRAAVKTWPQATAQRRVAVLRAALHDATLDQLGSSFCPAGSWFFPRSANSRSRNVASEGRHPYVPGAVPEEGRSGKDGVAVPRPSGTGPPLRAELELGEVEADANGRRRMGTDRVP